MIIASHRQRLLKPNKTFVQAIKRKHAYEQLGEVCLLPVGASNTALVCIGWLDFP